jgi:Ras GTPase-activating-like protein IQGAP2/3
MLDKHKRRRQRRREMESLMATLKNLEQKGTYMLEQKKSYNDYIQSCLLQLANKK